MKLTATIITLCLNIFTYSQTFIDKRDGNVYQTVKVGNQVWMAENLRSKQTTEGVPLELKMSNDDWINYGLGYTYNINATDSGNQVGYLYNYISAVNVCPYNWHLPTIEEWDSLANNISLETGIEFTKQLAGSRARTGSFSKSIESTIFWSSDFTNNEYSFYSLGNRSQAINNWDAWNLGFPVRCVQDNIDKSLTIVHDSINLHSSTKKKWTIINTPSNYLDLTIEDFKNSSISQLLFSELKKQKSIINETNTFISPFSKNKNYFAMIILEEPNVFFFNLKDSTINQLDIYSPYPWISWSPNQEYALFYHYYEGDPTLYSYNITNNTLTTIEFYNNIDKGEIGFVSPYEMLDIDFKNIQWVNDNEFEIIGKVYSDPYAFSEDENIELPIPDKVNENDEVIPFRTYMYTFNSEKCKVTNTILITE